MKKLMMLSLALVMSAGVVTSSFSMTGWGDIEEEYKRPGEGTGDEGTETVPVYE